MKKGFLPLLAVITFNAFAGSGQISYETFRRLSTPDYRQKITDWLGLGYTTEKAIYKFDAFATGDFRFYHGNSDYMISIPEAYLRYEGSNYKVTLGKQVLDWNQADGFWGLGDLNGLQGFSLLDDKAEGVIGLNIDMKLSKNFNLELFGSYLHIPNLNPGYQFDNGKVTSRSEWVKLPPSQTVVMDNEVPIHYDHDDVNLKDILIHGSLGARLSYRPTQNHKVSAYTLYKPENKLRMNAEGNLDISMDHVDVVAKPYVNHHLLMGINFESQLKKNFFFTGGYEYIDPNADLEVDLLVVDPVTFFENDADDFDADYFKIRPKQERNHYVHFGASWVTPKRTFSVRFINSFNKLKEGGDDFFGGMVKWRRAVGLLYKRSFSDALQIAFNFNYDFLLRDSIITNEISYAFSKSLAASAGVELIRSPNRASYWSSYRSNDIFFTNFRYIF